MRDHLALQIQPPLAGTTVTLAGWVESRRDHGQVIFIDLRDRSGIVQIVADPDLIDSFEVAESLRGEFVIQATGEVRERTADTVNPTLATGQVEIMANSITVLNKSAALPFQLDETGLSETVRLKYRYLDLRREEMQKGIRMRHALISELRAFLNEQEFVEIETPVLTRSTPEGARDYLVPSRTQPGHFFALPQSPQLFKQLLMVGGFERYYQIARCFRDEDLRADRQPEFTQLDVEMSFVNEGDVIALMEKMVRRVFKQVVDVDLPADIPHLTYHEAMHRYGSDRPDLRMPFEFTDVTDLMKQVDFKVFAGPANADDGRVAALCVPGAGSLTRQQIDQYTEFVKPYGAKGLAYIKVNTTDDKEGLQSPILKFLPDDVAMAIVERSGAKAGDMIFFGADKASVVNDALGALRVRIGLDLELADVNGWYPMWVIDFPLVEYDADAKRYNAIHHPFTAPNEADLDKMDTDPGAVNSRAYDLVINGMEIGGGSIRIHRTEVQERVFKLLGIGDEEAQAKFGFLLDALRYGAPPHGGIAFGIDRLAAMMSGFESIRDVIAFPKTQRASCLMTEAPSEVDPTQLRDLGIRLRVKPGASTEPSS